VDCARAEEAPHKIAAAAHGTIALRAVDATSFTITELTFMTGYRPG
jgi:hypothetical protein